MIYNEKYWAEVAEAAAHIPEKDRLQGKRILITGATGMLCSPVVDVLTYLKKEEGMSIELLLAGRSEQRLKDRFRKAGTEFTYIPFDATKTGFPSVKADYIIHGASNANPALYGREPVETLLGNVLGMESILKAAKENEGARVLYLSSSEVYGTGKDEREPYGEEDYGFVDLLNFRACYPVGKRAAETLCACYRQEYGVDFVTIRPGHIYGPTITGSDTRASAAFTRDAAAKRDIVMKSAGAQLRSYCYTLDSATAVLTVLLCGASGEAYNISNPGSVVSIRDIAEKLAEAGGVKVVFETPSDQEKKNYNLMSNSSLKADKLLALGWKPIFDLDRGVRSTLEFYDG